jgi:hypothetical protein
MEGRLRFGTDRALRLATDQGEDDEDDRNDENDPRPIRHDMDGSKRAPARIRPMFRASQGSGFRIAADGSLAAIARVDRPDLPR